MAKFMDLTGQRYGRLVVLRRGEDYVSPNGRRQVRWVCKCDCGNIKEISAIHLRNGDIVSCGCFHKERLVENGKIVGTKHNMSRTRIYGEYSRMKYRCNNEKGPSYANYGGRGIGVCEEWNRKDGFVAFYNWAMENGYSDELTLDRIDVNGNYEPSNCRWVDWETQYNNTTKTVTLSYEGKTMSVAQWGRELGLDRHTLYGRIKNGLPIEEVFDPKHRVGGRYKYKKPSR